MSDDTTTAAARLRFLATMRTLGDVWLRVFQDEQEFYSAAYWDLFTGMWSVGRPMKKTEALELMRSVSGRTREKYLNTAIANDYLTARTSDGDRRVVLVELSPAFRQRLDGYMDAAVGAIQEAFGPNPG